MKRISPMSLTRIVTLSIVIILFFSIVVTAHATKKDVAVGDIITYGHYEQDNNKKNGKEPIEWIVIKVDEENNRALLLSRYGLDAHRFDRSKYQGWDSSEIRKWMNSTFLKNAFNSKEQAAIEITIVKTGDNEEWINLAKKEKWKSDELQGGADTKDKLFLLSLGEVMEYGKYDTLEECYDKETEEKLQTVPTKYAMANGVE